MGFSARAENRVFSVRGIVKEIHRAKREVIVRHEEIPDYMAAMTMPFSVRDARIIDPLKAGDEITFSYHVTTNVHWIDNIKVVRSGVALPPNSRPNLEEFKPGDAVPDLPFVDQNARPFRFTELRGQAFALTFVFTRCPLPNFCPLLSQKFRAAQESLSTPGTPKNWKLISLTIDPAHDTPTVLRRYGEAQNADFNRWSFATGELRDITVLALRSGVNFWDESGSITHNVRTL